MTSPFALAADRYIASPHEYFDDPVGWVKSVVGEFLWSKQREILEALRDHRRVAVQSCHGSGKSYDASRAGAWWIDSHPQGEAMLITTAPTFPQVRAILWKELRRAHAKGGLAGYMNKTEWLIDNQLVGLGRKPADYDEQAFQGIHAPYILVELDEAGGIPKNLFDDAASLITNDAGRMLAIGNPDNPDSYFAEICKPGSGWYVIKISAFDTPNFTGEWVPEELRQVLVGHEWVDQAKRDWGEESPLYISKVLGEFPEDATETVVPFSAVAACRIPMEGSEEGPKRLGMDVGAGGDKTVITFRSGKKVMWQRSYSTPDAMAAVGYAVQAIKDTGAERIMVDVIGVGWGVAGRLDELRKDNLHNCRVIPVNVGQNSHDTKKYPKLRDQLWWEARDRSVDREWDLSELSDEAISQLVAPRYMPDSSGRNKVEKKDETRVRIGRSPDDADSLLLAFYEAPGTGPMKSYGRQIAAARI